MGLMPVVIGQERDFGKIKWQRRVGDRSWEKPILEVHLLASLPSSLFPLPSSLISFIRFIRPERKFASIDDLKRQIAADCATITT